MRKELFIFDLDGTLTESKQAISKKMEETLWNMQKKLVIISGASLDQMRKQFPSVSAANMDTYVMAQSGNVLRRLDEVIWEHKMDWRAKRASLNHIQAMLSTFQFEFEDSSDIVEDRGSQISFSFLGHHADNGKKKRYDPRGEKRKKYLETVPFISPHATVRIGGTTCLDYTGEGMTKGDNIKKLFVYLKVKPGQAVYFGDKFMNGGSDETVKGVCDIVEVEGPADTLEKMKSYTI